MQYDDAYKYYNLSGEMTLILVIKSKISPYLIEITEYVGKAAKYVATIRYADQHLESVYGQTQTEVYNAAMKKLKYYLLQITEEFKPDAV